MNQTLKTAIEEVEALPEDDQEELAQTLLDLASRKRIDARLAESERRSGATPHEGVFERLRTKYAG